jgi:hypothetical protein
MLIEQASDGDPQFRREYGVATVIPVFPILTKPAA